jgi:hypothetical protein
MPSTFTNNLGVEKPGDGEQTGTWGITANLNFDIFDRASNGSVALPLIGTSSTLSTLDGALSDGQYRLLVLTGTPGATHTITIAPNDAQKIYLVRNDTAQSVVFTQGSGGNATLVAGAAAVIYASGSGSGAAVTNLGLVSGNGAGASGTWGISITGGAATATTAAAWTTSRTLTIGATGKAVDGSANVSWTLGEIGAVAPDGTGASGTWGISITGNAATATAAATATTATTATTAAAWTTSRTLTIGATGKAVDGSANVSWTLGEVGAQPVDATLTALAGLDATAGILTQTGEDTFVRRSIAGTADQITVTNPAGTAGNPTIAAVIASQAEAEAGTDNTKLMTGLRVAQAIRRVSTRTPLYAAVVPAGAAILLSPLPIDATISFDISNLRCSGGGASNRFRVRASRDGGATFTDAHYIISATANWDTTGVYGRFKILNVANAVSGLTSGFEFSISAEVFGQAATHGIFPDVAAFSGGINALEFSFTSGTVANIGNVFVTYEYEA